MVNPSAFPSLQAEGFTDESPVTPIYNCIAWAAGDSKKWWWPTNRYYWPNNCPREETIDAFMAMFAALGYEECGSSDLEVGFEKVAIYALNGVPTHAARLRPDGTWTSKLGRNVDIGHTLSGLEGPEYGTVEKFMRRERVDS